MLALSSGAVAIKMAGVALLMAAWWITEALPLYATALLPLVLYPLVGIMSGKSVAPVYINSTIFLFLGGFMIAFAMERWNLHKRISLWIIKVIGGGPSRIIFGFMVAAAFLSMWISNTATAIMMVPIGQSVIYQMETKFGADSSRKFSVGLMLGIAYSCSVGGMATLVGTPPNLSFSRIFEITFPAAPPIAFGQWLCLGLPITVIMLALIWTVITKITNRIPEHIKLDRAIIEDEYRSLGPISFEEKSVRAIFFTTAVLWVFRKKLVLGFVTIPGWSEILPHAKMIDDGTVAIFMALSMFLIPAKDKSRGPMIMDAGTITKLPWNIVILFGGGFALAKGFQDTGLSTIIGGLFQGLAGVSPFVIILLLCLTLSFLTELTSNTATTEMILPILAAISVAVGFNPLLLMIPATLSASCAFMMPVATPPNAIVFGSGRIKIKDMVRTGIILNIICAVVLTTVFYFIGSAVFSIDANVMPGWAVLE